MKEIDNTDRERRDINRKRLKYTRQSNGRRKKSTTLTERGGIEIKRDRKTQDNQTVDQYRRGEREERKCNQMIDQKHKHREARKKKKETERHKKIKW